MTVKNQIDNEFIRNVKDYMLPKPLKKSDKDNKSESLKELGIISVETGIWSSCI